MMSDHSKKPLKLSDIAQQFRELQQLRQQVHEAELDFSRDSPAVLRAADRAQNPNEK